MAGEPLGVGGDGEAGMLKLDRKGRLLVSEREVQKACVELLRSRGWLVFETHTDARKSMGEVGQPDLVAVRFPGRPVVNPNGWAQVLMLEVKRKDGRVSKDQRTWHVDAERRGFRVHIIRDAKELENLL